MVFTRWCRALSPDPVLPGGRVGVGGRDRRDHRGCDRISTRFGIGEVACWESATAVSRGRLLMPGCP
jgi:hypothetical protein